MSQPAPTVSELVANPVVRAALDAAWIDSQPADPITRHEEGGWVYCDPATRTIEIRRAPGGDQAFLDLDDPPELPGYFVVATFHTHPNPSAEGWNPAPSADDNPLCVAARCSLLYPRRRWRAYHRSAITTWRLVRRSRVSCLADTEER